MMRVVLCAALGLGALTALSTSPAEARFFGNAVEAPTLVETAQCVVRRERVVRPDGRVVVRTVRRCGPGFGPRVERCRTVRERVYRPGGRVVVRTVRRCF